MKWVIKAFCVASMMFMLAITAFVQPANAIPELRGYVNDYANLLSEPEKRLLTEKLKSLKKAKLVILLPQNLEGRTIEEFSMDVVTYWKIGQRKIDDGLLLTVAPHERKMRLEVGYGLEGQIPDAKAREVLGVMKPYLAKGKERWFTALDAAIDKIKQLVGE